MDLSGTWQFTETWTVNNKKLQPYSFNATFQPDGTVTLDPADGFAMVWYTGPQQGFILAGDHPCSNPDSSSDEIPQILAAYYGTMTSNNTISGTANGQMVISEAAMPVTGTWSATQVS